MNETTAAVAATMVPDHAGKHGSMASTSEAESMETTVNPLPRGSRLDAYHPEYGAPYSMPINTCEIRNCFAKSRTRGHN
jgi:hypothetical protein